VAASWTGAERWAGIWMFICEMKLSRSSGGVRQSSWISCSGTPR
jgi:hypothetical protein